MCMFLTFDTVQQIITIRSSQFHSETNVKCFHISRAIYKCMRCVRTMKIHLTQKHVMPYNHICTQYEFKRYKEIPYAR